MNRRNNAIYAGAALLSICASLQALAQTAGMMSFQGLIRDSGGVAAQGAMTLSLQIVDAGNVVIDASGNGSVGAEDTFIVNTTAEQGIVSVNYGPIAPSAFNGSQRFLKVTVTSPGGYPALTPVEIVTPPAIAEQLNIPGTGSPALRINSNGNVGIGFGSTPGPSRLSVNGAGDFGPAPNNGNSLNVYGDAAGRLIGCYSSGFAAGMSGSSLLLEFKVGSNPAAVIRNLSSGQSTPGPLLLNPEGGNIGIGTTSPNERLTVAGSVALDGFNFFYARATPGSNADATSLGFSGQIGGVLTLSNNGNNEIRAGRGSSGGQLRFFVNNTADPFTASNGIQAMTIGSNGRVEIGAPSVSAQLAIRRDDDGRLLSFERAGRESWWVGPANTGGGTGLAFANETDGAVRLMLTEDGNVGVGTTAPSHPLQVGTSPGANNGNGAHCTIGGVWTNASDRNAKTNFADIDPLDVLARVVAMPVTSWRYTGECESTRHIGPVAQDFYASFGLGESDRHIGTIDSEGVALAAIQGLNQKLEDKDREIAELKARMQRLEELLGAQIQAQSKEKK